MCIFISMLARVLLCVCMCILIAHSNKKRNKNEIKNFKIRYDITPACKHKIFLLSILKSFTTKMPNRLLVSANYYSL